MAEKVIWPKGERPILVEKCSTPVMTFAVFGNSISYHFEVLSIRSSRICDPFTKMLFSRAVIEAEFVNNIFI